MSEKEQPTCLACGISSQEIPLLSLIYRDQTLYICPQDIPTLIHHPDQLIGRLPGADKLQPQAPAG